MNHPRNDITEQAGRSEKYITREMDRPRKDIKAEMNRLRMLWLVFARLGRSLTADNGSLFVFMAAVRWEVPGALLRSGGTRVWHQRGAKAGIFT